MTFRTSVRQPSASTVLVSEQRQRESIASVSPTTPRRLIVCIDGTANQYSEKNTNVIELYSHIEKSDTQLTYYNSGIGTYAKPSWKSMAYLKQVVSSRIDLAIAWNLDRVIIGAYRWLSDNYRPGDQIFLFGFSRGAYQVRAIAGMIATVGLIFPGNQEQIPFAFELYASYADDIADPTGGDVWHSRSAVASNAASPSKQKIDTFRKTFSRNLLEVHFLGAWDTVSSIGLRRGSLLPLTNRHEHIKYFRHALALDERRVKFLPEYVDYDGEGDTDKEHVKEVWFAGTHSDIGGGNTINVNLDRGTESLVWMINEAESAGLRMDSKNLGYGVRRAEVIKSLRRGWWLFEILPLARVTYKSDRKRMISRPHLGKGREISPYHRLHYSVLANHMQADRKNYQPVASFGKPGSGPKFVWKDVFSDANEDEPMNSFALNWEGDKRITKALEIVRSIDDVVDETLYSEDQSHEWLDNVLQLVSDRAFAKMIWEYGGLQFLLKLAGFEDKGFVPQIIRSVVGMQSSSNPVQLYQSSFLSLPSINVNAEPQHVLFPLISDNMDSKLQLEDVIPRLHDLLTCYKYLEPEDEIVSNRSNWVSTLGKIRASIIKKTKEWIGSSGPSRGQEPQQAHGTTSTRARRSTADSTKSQTGLIANAPAMTLVWVGMVMISEIAKDGLGATAIVRSGDVIPPLVSFINIKQPLGDSLSPKLHRLIKAAIGAIGDLATADGRAREEFYNRRTAQKLIRLMKGSSHFTKKTLKTLTALATDQRNLRDMVDSGFVDILSNSLNNSDPQIVAQAIKTVLAIAEDEITNALLVDGEFVPKILRILLKDQDGTRTGAIRAIRRLSGNHKARSQIFRHQAVPTMSSLVRSNPEAMLVVESLASHDKARSLMLENGTLSDLVPLIDNPSTYLSQRAIHTVTAFATHEDALPQVIEQNVVQRLVGALERDSLVGDALEAVTQLAGYEEVRVSLIQSDLFLQLVSILKHQKAGLVDRNSVNKPDLPFPNYEEYMTDPSAIPIKTVRTVANLAEHDDLRKKILESDVIEALLDLGAPRHKRKSFASPFAEEDIELSKEVLKTLTKLVRYDDSRKALMENEVALQLLGWLLVPQFQAPELAYQAMIALKEISEYDDTVPSLMRYPNIGEGVIRARSLSTASHLVREAKVVFEKFSKHPDPESQAKFKQYLSNANPSFADSTDLLAPSNRSQHAVSHYGPVESPAHSNDGHDIPPNEPVAADARNQGIRFSLQVPPVHRGAH